MLLISESEVAALDIKVTFVPGQSKETTLDGSLSSRWKEETEGLHVPCKVMMVLSRRATVVTHTDEKLWFFFCFDCWGNKIRIAKFGNSPGREVLSD